MASEWQTVNSNHISKTACVLQKLEVEEGTLYRHTTQFENAEHINPEVALLFVEKKR